ncbi:1,2-dihydroxy-3-keto-5-methylthiopentene dioxygenase [Zancudomyces culisetae]|uniref:Acireductone dioxygenase n=1 Tax=Zancudomyces culisetae TaxID=1213189 RepID=A0A1R1PXA5_ZANCU|nr:1,2-dihydroxy-3-keto-5-methylthiopentene dioxygenase [Zancudomyces culisetae]|eukprot:OMH85601.1 1,2-dihydroxy-3-keto-5-methylthiopentene dioxygenase [Zancudomyces culisetae]
MRAYYYLDDGSDKKLTHVDESRPKVTLEQLNELGVFAETFDISSDQEVAKKLDEISTKRGYVSRDNVVIGKDIEGIEDKLDIFFTEHLHVDEEIRFINEGSGYFDVRDKNDEWIRISVSKNDFLIIPAGIFHRFTITPEMYVKATRLFKANPSWVPVNRVDGGQHLDIPERKEYVDAYLS